MPQLVTVTKYFWQLSIVTSRFLAVTFRDITLYVVNKPQDDIGFLNLDLFLF